MSKQRVPLGIRSRVLKTTKKEAEKPTEVQKTKSPNSIKKQKIATPKEPSKGKGRPSTKKGKKLTKYSMDIHPDLKRAVIKAAAIYDKDVHVMWNEIIFDWFSKEQKKHPEWYTSINVKKSEL